MSNLFFRRGHPKVYRCITPSPLVRVTFTATTVTTKPSAHGDGMEVGRVWFEEGPGVTERSLH